MKCSVAARMSPNENSASLPQMEAVRAAAALPLAVVSAQSLPVRRLLRAGAHAAAAAEASSSAAAASS